MSEATRDRLYKLLPAIYRLRDAAEGEPLRALLSVIESEFQAIETDIAALYNNQFIETCDEWVVTYIGDLLGVRGLHPVAAANISQRAYIANTLSYRRSKGTIAVLERLARDVTGWPAQAVEFFELLATTQYLNHTRLYNHRTPDLRDSNGLNLLDGPFDKVAHTADVRHIANRRGKHNIANVGLFLWRLESYPLTFVTARQAAAPHEYGYHFSPLGSPAPLFNRIGEPGSVEELLVPASIRPLAFYLDLKSYFDRYNSVPPQERPFNSDYCGPERSLRVKKDETIVVPPIELMCKNLSQWERPPAGHVAIDVELGRIAFALDEEPDGPVIVDYAYGFSADIGGGPYDRRSAATQSAPDLSEIILKQGTAISTLQAALQEWEDQGKPRAIIRIEDNGTYEANALTIELPGKGWLAIEAANARRPHLLVTYKLSVIGPTAPSAPDDQATLSLSGLLVEGQVEAQGKLNLRISDSTLVPGLALDEDGFPKQADQASLVVVGDDLADLAIIIDRSISGPLKIPAGARGLIARDSIIDAPTANGAAGPARAAISSDDSGNDPGPPTTLERCTIFGKVHVRELSLASEVIFTATALAERKQVGCVRFSYVPEGSKTPRRYYCQPDLALAHRAQELGLDGPGDLLPEQRKRVLLRVKPRLTSARYGVPAYGQLGPSCADEIRAGAEDGSEMGVFSNLKQPQREANLRAALNEYLRFGLEAGIFFVT